jgi:DtxR family Mn-dependent transcriptional regulator
MREKLTNTIEDYLKTIFEITRSNKRASTSQIADALGVAPASVTGMVKKLSQVEPPLLYYQRHQGVTLTVEGERVALEVIRHHRLLEMFLQQILGYEWDQVHAEADRLEHVISEEFEERIAQALGNPSYDPHGDPIPTRDFTIPHSPSNTLADLLPGQNAIIRRVNSTDADLLRHLGDLGLVPKTIITILDYSPFDKNTTIQIIGKDTPIVLGSAVTKQIFVDVASSTKSYEK